MKNADITFSGQLYTVLDVQASQTHTIVIPYIHTRQELQSIFAGLNICSFHGIAAICESFARENVDTQCIRTAQWPTIANSKTLNLSNWKVHKIGTAGNYEAYRICSLTQMNTSRPRMYTQAHHRMRIICVIIMYTCTH